MKYDYERWKAKKTTALYFSIALGLTMLISDGELGPTRFKNGPNRCHRSPTPINVFNRIFQRKTKTRIQVYEKSMNRALGQSTPSIQAAMRQWRLSHYSTAAEFD